MYSKKDLEIELKNRMNNNEISEAVNLIEKEIKNLYISKIQMFNKNAKYIDIATLKKDVEQYLSQKEKTVFKKFFIIINTETNELYQLDRMIDIYNVLKEGENNDF